MKKRLLIFVLLAVCLARASAQFTDKEFLIDVVCEMRRDSSGIRASLASLQMEVRESGSNSDLGWLLSREADLRFYGQACTFSGATLKQKSSTLVIPLTNSQVLARAKSAICWLDERAPYSVDLSSIRFNSDPQEGFVFAAMVSHGFPYQRKLTCRVDRTTGDVTELASGLLPSILRVPPLTLTSSQAESRAIQYLTGAAASGTFSAVLTKGPRWCSLSSALKPLRGDLRNMSASELESARQNHAILCYMITFNDGTQPPNDWSAFVDAETGKVLYAGRNGRR